MIGLPYSYAVDNPIDLMNKVVYHGACTSLDDDVGTGLAVSPILLTDCFSYDDLTWHDQSNYDRRATKLKIKIGVEMKRKYIIIAIVIPEFGIFTILVLGVSILGTIYFVRKSSFGSVS